MNATNVTVELNKKADPMRANGSKRFFKNGKGQNGEGDVFIGVSVPDQHLIAKAHKDLSIEELNKLLNSKIHEHRLTSLFILRYQYDKADLKGKKALANFYFKNRRHINNWDLVDASAPYIYGDYLKQTNHDVLYKLASSKSLWDRRIAIVSTFAWIKEGRLNVTIEIADMLLNDDQDLIHKAVGWALREVGKKDELTLTNYLDKKYKVLPRTTLRYAIERLTATKRRHYLSK